MSMDTILSFIQPIVGFFAGKYGAVGTVMGYLVACVPVMSILMELIEFIIQLVKKNSSDPTAAKIQAVWDKIMPFLEVLPHSNIPLSPVMISVM